MSDEETPPPESVAPDSPHERTGRDGREREGRRRRLEGVIPEIVRRAVELGVEKAQEAPDNLKQFVGDLKLPKEIAHYLFSQIDETKNGLFRVVAKEMRDFLEHTNFAGEMQKLLTTVQFEVNTTIRFTPNDGRDPKRSKSKPPPAPDESAKADSDQQDDDESPDSGERQPLPKPEVKTAVHVKRPPNEERSRRSKRDRDE